MLQSDRAMREHSQRFALDLGITVGHPDRRFFVTTSDELRRFVAAVVDYRFLQAAETRSGIGANVLDTKRFDDIDHEI
jgi:hypothetical protein